MAAVQEARVFILCWCCAGQRSDFIAKEIRTALQDTNKKLVPVLFCSTALPPKIADRQWIDLRSQIVHSCDPEHPENPGANPVTPGPKSYSGMVYSGWDVRRNYDSGVRGHSERMPSQKWSDAGWRGYQKESKSREYANPKNPMPPSAPYATSSGGCGYVVVLLVLLGIALGALTTTFLYLRRPEHAHALITPAM
jgi:hypothetical protein